jgi:hypothetical protein
LPFFPFLLDCISFVAGDGFPAVQALQFGCDFALEHAPDHAFELFTQIEHRSSGAQLLQLRPNLFVEERRLEAAEGDRRLAIQAKRSYVSQ